MLRRFIATYVKVDDLRDTNAIIKIILVILWVGISVSWSALTNAASAAQFIQVSAEGLADPEAEAYRRDKALMLDALLEDAQRQAIEKVVGSYVDSSTLVENYTLIQDKVLTRSKGLIKRILSKNGPWLGEDGFMHLIIQAEVAAGNVKSALDEMSRQERLALIRERGDPKIAVAVVVRNAERGGDTRAENSEIAENLLKEQIRGFGYRVWSLSETASARANVDFTIRGEAKFKPISFNLPASGLKVNKYVLTSWTVACVYNPTGEEVYFNNKVPVNKSWNSEDAALADIGKLIGAEFSKDFFESYLLKPSQVYELLVEGLPDYDTGLELKQQFTGLRSVLNVDFRSFELGGLSTFEVEMAGAGRSFPQLLNDTVLKPVNTKLRTNQIALISVKGKVAQAKINIKEDPASVKKELRESPPASIVISASQRIAELVKSDGALNKIKALNLGGQPGGTILR